MTTRELNRLVDLLDLAKDEGGFSDLLNEIEAVLWRAGRLVTERET